MYSEGLWCVGCSSHLHGSRPAKGGGEDTRVRRVKGAASPVQHYRMQEIALLWIKQIYVLIPHTVIYCNPNLNTCRKQSSCAHPQNMYTNAHCMHALKWSAHARTHALLHTSLQTHSNSYILSGRNVHGHIIVYPGCIKIHTIRTYSIQMCTNKDGDSIDRRPPSHSTDHLWSAVNVPLQRNQHTLHDHTGVACKPAEPGGASNKTMYSIVMFTHVHRWCEWVGVNGCMGDVGAPYTKLSGPNAWPLASQVVLAASVRDEGLH